MIDRLNPRFDFSGYTDAQLHALRQSALLWDGVLFGGLAALTASILLIALLARNVALLLLGLICALVTWSELRLRGYDQMFPWLDLSRLAPGGNQAVYFLGWAAMLAFALLLARAEKIRLPAPRLLWGVGMLWSALAAAALVGNPAVFQQIRFYGRFFMSALLILVAFCLVRRSTPTARLALFTLLFSLFNTLLRLLGEHGRLPAWLDSPIHPNPFVAILGMFTWLGLFSTWIYHVGRQRQEAREMLIVQQRSEQDRLREEVARRTRELNEALNYAEEKNQQKIETVGYIGHDLRAPLATIQGYACLLRERAVPSQEKLIHAIQRSVEYQLGLIDDLMEYAKAELRPLDIRPEPVNLPALLANISEYATALCLQQNNRFSCAADTDIPLLAAVDGSRLQQVLLNLLANAAKFTRDGSVSLTVHAVPLGATRCRLRFEVRDTGIGMDLGRNVNIFGAFQQIQAVNGSTGLGLFIAQRIVAAMDGVLDVDSAVGQGSAFHFEFTADVLGEEAAWTQYSAAPAHFPGIPALPAPGIAPPGDALETLAELARNGQLSDIEDWLERLAPVASYGDYLARVRSHLDALDFLGIEMLATPPGRV